MATSGTYTYLATVNDILKDAHENIGVIADGETMSGAMVTLGLRKLNMIVKQWSGKIDFAPGLKMWTRKQVYVFLQKGTNKYTIGPSGSECTLTYATTTTSASAASGASSVTLTSATGITTGDRIGIEMTTGALHWTTVTISGSTATLAAALTAAVNSGARVFAYTAKAPRPLELETGNLRDTDNRDQEVDVRMTLEEYQATPNKTDDGTPDGVYFEATTTNATIYINREPDDVTKVLVFSVLLPVQDTTAITEDVDFPQEWFRALSAQLSIDLSIPYGRPAPPDLGNYRDEAVRMAQEAYGQTTPMCFQPFEDGQP